MPSLPPLPLEEWRPTKDTLHLWTQVVGKVRLALAPPRNHWWHVTLHPDVRGITTGPLRAGDLTFAIVLDLAADRLDVAVRGGGHEGFPLEDGLTVADFHARLMRTLGDLGVRVPMVASPYGVPMTTPFPEDADHRSYSRAHVRAWWDVVDWTAGVLEEFSGRFCGKASPVHLFWHSFDLAHTRFSGRRAAGDPPSDPVAAEAYSHEVVSFGFWAGDDQVPFPAFYSYTAPEPPGLSDAPLGPAAAHWRTGPTGSLALLPYEAVRTALDPRGTLLDFLESAYRGGAERAGWDVAGLRSSWALPDVAPTGQD